MMGNSFPKDNVQNDPLLAVHHLQVHFPIRDGLLRRQVGAIRAVDDVTFAIARGETLALVGESGVGKTLLGRSILQLTQPTGGRVVFAGQDVTRPNPATLRTLRRQVHMLFQDPYRSLNPRMPVGKLVAEPLAVHNMGRAAEREARVAALLQQVGLNPYCAARPPFDFSGLQRQRVNLARALASEPVLLILDEPLTRLDPVLHPQMMALLAALRTEHDLTYLLLAQDLAYVRDFAQQVGVMYAGRVVELGDVAAVWQRPFHPYTQILLSQLPDPELETETKRQRLRLEGKSPDPARLPAGCHFHPRCPYVADECRRVEPEYRNMGTAERPHWVACHFAAVG
ncbi:MAG: ATP-binding cassette domain-containing protein [Anaerolineales bacterium]|nr:ATP-binding cassette domain-containing protein [Anaerolineales bacterium]